MKSFRLIIILCLGFTLLACSSDGSEEAVVEVTLDIIAQEFNAFVGEENIVYRMDKKHTNDDGSYIMINIQSVRYYDTYLVNNGDTIKNVIVIENGLPIEENAKMVKDVAYFIAVDSEGDEVDVGDVYTQSGTEFSEIIFSASDAELTNQVRYIIIGGLDTESNASSKVVFKVD